MLRGRSIMGGLRGGLGGGGGSEEEGGVEVGGGINRDCSLDWQRSVGAVSAECLISAWDLGIETICVE